MDLEVIRIIVTLIFLEGILSIDNAALLGAMVAHLPNDQPIPWPKRLQFLTDWSMRVLGPQRQAALKVGLLGAYIGRGLMLILAAMIINVPWIRILGALYLVYLALNHFGEFYHKQRREEHGEEKWRQKAKGGFWSVVLAVELADLAFSVDNVIAAVALSRELWVVLLGVAIGIVIMRFAATIFTKLISWEPSLEHGAYLLLFAIGGELVVEEILHWHIGESVQFALSASILTLTIVVSRTSWLRKPVSIFFKPVLALIAAIQTVISFIMSLLLLPFNLFNTR
ncbi:MAG: putative membrane protein YceF [Herpetosiphonaceae bacterium]|nr:MAG: putative membrane protein YceF [Herpetosiphonaceae bacterium]